MSTKATRTVLKLLAEYCLLTFPILIYVSMEALHHQSLAYLLVSPEWSVGTIFLLLQTYRLYTERAHSAMGHRFGDLLVLGLVTVAIAASVNIYMSLDTAAVSWPGLVTKWCLFVLATVVFVYIAGAAIYSQQEEGV